MEKEKKILKFIVQKDFVLDKLYKRGNEILLSDKKTIDLLLTNKLIK